jgi:hypothetical protein
MAAHEADRRTEHAQQEAVRLAAVAAEAGAGADKGGGKGGGKGGKPKAVRLPPNPMMLGLSPPAYVLRSVRPLLRGEGEGTGGGGGGGRR